MMPTSKVIALIAFFESVATNVDEEEDFMELMLMSADREQFAIINAYVECRKYFKDHYDREEFQNLSVEDFLASC